MFGGLRSERVCNVNSVGNQRATSEGGFGVWGLADPEGEVGEQCRCRLAVRKVNKGSGT